MCGWSLAAERDVVVAETESGPGERQHHRHRAHREPSAEGSLCAIAAGGGIRAIRSARRIAFSSLRDNKTKYFNIFTMDPNGGDVRQLTFIEFDAQRPNWSPDGSQIAFHSDLPEGTIVGGFNVFTIRSDGSHLTRLTSEPDAGHPAWSPDGRQIAFGNGRTGDGEIWTMLADGSQQLQLTMRPLTDDFDPDWRPLP
jgi:Tol biopolymer transport system component